MEARLTLRSRSSTSSTACLLSFSYGSGSRRTNDMSRDDCGFAGGLTPSLHVFAVDARVGLRCVPRHSKAAVTHAVPTSAMLMAFALSDKQKPIVKTAAPGTMTLRVIRCAEAADVDDESKQILFGRELMLLRRTADSDAYYNMAPPTLNRYGQADGLADDIHVRLPDDA
ncbi:hypothetical protein PSPO01_16666 [Paraphaeosphaeria sporulosa]